MSARLSTTAVLFVTLTCVPVGVTEAGHDNIVLRWNAEALEAVRHSTLPPPAIARALAILHTCIYDAWAAYQPTAAGNYYHVKASSTPDDEPVVRAISFAAHRALVDLFPARRAHFDALLVELGYDPMDANHADSRLGVDAAQAGLHVRFDDGANQRAGYADYTGYVPVNTPDVLVDPFRWQPLRMADGTVQQYALPHWGHVQPFALPSADALRPPPPVFFPHGLYRKQAIEILHMSAQLTDRDKVIAGYWADGPRTETPPGHWCLFAAFVSRRDGHTVEQDVKLFFVLTNALMDAGIAAWDAKGHYDYVRPVTAIRFLFGGQPVRAGAGPFLGTLLIPGDTWRSYVATPPFPDYVSGHSTFSAASAEVLRLFTGSDRFDAQVTIPAGGSPIEPGLVPRTDVTLVWRTFSEAADEAGLSRRVGGIHFEDADLAGRAMGRRIGALVWKKARAHFDGIAPTSSASH
jgi:hypothetical protein